MVSRAGVLSAVVVGSAMVFLDGTVVNVALPKIGQELPSTLFGTLEAQSYVYNVYLLSLSALLILAGALGDHYGRRRMFALGLIGFTLTSVLCGVAPTMEFLILARFLQGAAGALLVPGSLSIITATFPEGEPRGQGPGDMGRSDDAGDAGRTFGGRLLGRHHLVAGGVPDQRPPWCGGVVGDAQLRPRIAATSPTSARLDWLGAAVVAVAIGGLVLGAIRGQESQWQDTAAWVALVLGLAAAIAFPFLMKRSDSPPRSARTIPELELHHHQHLDSSRVRGDLRGGLRDGPFPPGHGGVHRSRLPVWPGFPDTCCSGCSRSASACSPGDTARAVSW